MNKSEKIQAITGSVAGILTFFLQLLMFLVIFGEFEFFFVSISSLVGLVCGIAIYHVME